MSFSRETMPIESDSELTQPESDSSILANNNSINQSDQSVQQNLLLPSVSSRTSSLVPQSTTSSSVDLRSIKSISPMNINCIINHPEDHQLDSSNHHAQNSVEESLSSFCSKECEDEINQLDEKSCLGSVNYESPSIENSTSSFSPHPTIHSSGTSPWSQPLSSVPSPGSNHPSSSTVQHLKSDQVSSVARPKLPSMIVRLKIKKPDIDGSNQKQSIDSSLKRSQDELIDPGSSQSLVHDLATEEKDFDINQKKAKRSNGRGRARGVKRGKDAGARSSNSANRTQDEPPTLPSFEEICNHDGNLPESLELKTQTKTCVAFPYQLRRYRCSPCISKAVGFVCAFRFFRQWVCSKKSDDMIAGPVLPLINTSEDQLSYRYPSFPKQFNRRPETGELMGLCKLLSKVLLPSIESELKWLEDNSVRFVGRRLDLATKCDYCLATLIGAAWMCKQCGAEACLRCYQVMVQYVTIGNADGGESSNDQRIKLEMHDDWLKKLLICTKWWKSHHPSTHIKISHITSNELEVLRQQMFNAAQAETSGYNQFSSPLVSSSENNSVPSDLRRFLYQPPGEDSEPYVKIDIDELEADPHIFHRLWAAGQAIVVTGMKKRLRTSWDPDYFIKNYGSDTCNMLDSNETRRPPVAIKVKEFFNIFENEPEDGKPVWKLRDWPPEVDFKEKFGELYDDFQNAIPIRDVTSRQGILNIAAHFPTNANVPDLGPKMYIAMNNSKDKSQSGYSEFNGSTVLHMDVADAINIQTYAGKNEDGYALWHLFHAVHTEKLREFLIKYRAEKFNISEEKSKQAFDDPIHTTRIYVDEKMRRQLREMHGIKGWEIKQRPGEAVFIPAYTAHQVCNKANCIKVAADFVSPESINRCISLTEEFKNQNHEHRKPWRDDILQINQMLLYAFMSINSMIENQKST